MIKNSASTLTRGRAQGGELPGLRSRGGGKDGRKEGRIERENLWRCLFDDVVRMGAAQFTRVLREILYK